MARHTSGWLKLHRKIDTSWIGKDGYALAIWSKLLIWANREDGQKLVTGPFGKQILHRGQIATSAIELSKELGWDTRVIQRRLNYLEKGGSIVQQVSNHGRIITLCNFEQYQGQDEGDCPTIVPQSVSQGVSQEVRQGVDIMEKRRRREIKNTHQRTTAWDAAHPLSKAFFNLQGFEKYWSIFDLPKDEKTLRDHMEHYKLTIRDMEEVTRELRFWADGPNAEKVKSPRGTLATFVRNYADRAKSQPKQRELLTVTEADLDKLL